MHCWSIYKKRATSFLSLPGQKFTWPKTLQGRNTRQVQNSGVNFDYSLFPAQECLFSHKNFSHELLLVKATPLRDIGPPNISPVPWPLPLKGVKPLGFPGCKQWKPILGNKKELLKGHTKSTGGRKLGLWVGRNKASLEGQKSGSKTRASQQVESGWGQCNYGHGWCTFFLTLHHWFKECPNDTLYFWMCRGEKKENLILWLPGSLELPLL